MSFLFAGFQQQGGLKDLNSPVSPTKGGGMSKIPNTLISCDDTKSNSTMTTTATTAATPVVAGGKVLSNIGGGGGLSTPSTSLFQSPLLKNVSPILVNGDGDDDHEDDVEGDNGSWASISEIDTQYTGRSRNSSSFLSRNNSFLALSSVRSQSIIVSDSEGDDDDDDDTDDEDTGRGLVIDNLNSMGIDLHPDNENVVPPSPAEFESQILHPTPRAGNIAAVTGDDEDETISARSLQTGGDCTSEGGGTVLLKSRPPSPSSVSSSSSSTSESSSCSAVARVRDELRRQILEDAQEQVVRAQEQLRHVETELLEVRSNHTFQIEALSSQLSAAEQELDLKQKHHEKDRQLLQDELRVSKIQQEDDHTRLSVLQEQTSTHEQSIQELTNTVEQLEVRKKLAEADLVDARNQLTQLQQDLDRQHKSHKAALRNQKEQLTSNWQSKVKLLEESSKKKVQFVENRNEVLEFKLSECTNQLKVSRNDNKKLQRQVLDKENALQSLRVEHDTSQQTYRDHTERYESELTEIKSYFSEAQSLAESATTERDLLQDQVKRMESHESDLQSQLEDAKSQVSDMLAKIHSGEDDMKQIKSQLVLFQREKESLESQFGQLRCCHGDEIELLKQDYLNREEILNQQINNLQNRMERARSANEICTQHLEVVFEESKNLQIQLDASTEECRVANKKLSESELQVKQLQHRIADLELTILELRTEQDHLTHSHAAAIQTHVASIEMEKAATQAALSKVSCLESERSGMETKISSLQEESAVLQEKLVLLEKDRKCIRHENEQQIEVLQSKLNQLPEKATKEMHNELNVAYETNESLSKDVKSLGEQRLKLAQRLSDVELSYEEAKAQITKKDHESARLMNDIETVQLEVNELQVKYDTAVEQHEANSRSQSHLIQKHEHDLARKAEKIRALEAESENVLSERDQMIQEIELLKIETQSHRKESDKVSDKLAITDKQLYAVQNEKRSVEKELLDIQNKLEEAEGKHNCSLEQVESMKLIHELALQSLLLERDNSVSKLDETRNELNRLQSELIETTDVVEKLRTDSVNLAAKEADLLDEMGRLESETMGLELKLRKRTEALESAVEKIGVLEEEKSILQSQLSSANETIESLKGELSKLKVEFIDMTAKHSRALSAKASLLKSAEESIVALRTERDNLSIMVFELAQGNGVLKQKILEIEGESSALQRRFDDSQNDLEISKSKLCASEARVCEMESEKKDLINKRMSMEKQLAEKVLAMKTMQSNIDEKRSHAQAVKPSSSDVHSERQSLLSEVRILKKTQSDLETRIAAADQIRQDALDQLEDQKSESERLRSELSESQKYVSEAKKEHFALIEKLKHLQDVGENQDNELLEIQLEQANVAISTLQSQCSRLMDEKDRSIQKQMKLEHQNEVLQRQLKKNEKKITNLSKILKKSMATEFLSAPPKKHSLLLGGTISVPDTTNLGVVDDSSSCLDGGLVERAKGMQMQVQLQYRHKTTGELCMKEVHAKYTGPVVKSKPHGSGMLRFKGGDIYICDFVDGVMNPESGSFVRRRQQSKSVKSES
eukprot:CAMPEP_0113456472 /NCGR_PEP_ID=MMETSP0014_2-20120614/8905_1 /TAXON_ID=2857 /ORGANISM="Nitzschia sp." /LENGTH=1546 /DNA_ID=CAMNT_0000347927 /DNA_START=156 /DNA_END=4796 /DNA_ORIENTATION=- /assembly_acc=CAM_ASM_000159